MDKTDTDRIIAAHREEARRTRSLLLWIFVGIPLVAGFIWLIVVLVASDAGSSPGAVSDEGANASVASIAPAVSEQQDQPVDTPDVPTAVQNFVVTDHTMCSTIADWYGDAGTAGPINPADAAIYDGSDYDTPDPVDAYLVKKDLDPIDDTTIATNCSSNNGTLAADGIPDETVAAALKQGDTP